MDDSVAEFHVFTVSTLFIHRRLLRQRQHIKYIIHDITCHVLNVLNHSMKVTFTNITIHIIKRKH